MIASFNIIANTIDERDGTLGNVPIIAIDKNHN
jgi:hypothetical protein